MLPLLTRIFCLLALLLPSFLSAQTSFVKEISAVDYTYGKDFLVAPDGGYYLLLQAHPTSPAEWGPVLLRLDAQGNELWQRKYVAQSSQYESIDELRFDAHGNIIMTGTFNRVIKVDSLGNQIFAVEVPGVGLSDHRVEGMAIADNGDIALGLHYFSDKPRVIVLDSNGAASWIRSYTIPTTSQYAEDLDALPGGGYLMTTETGYLMRIDSATAGVWASSYAINQGIEMQSTLLEDDGTFTTVGALADANFQKHIALFRTNADGSFGWARLYETSEEMRGEDITPTADGGYLIAGSYQDRKVFLLKVDSTGAPVWNTYTDQIPVNRIKRIISTADGGCAIIGFDLGNNGNAFFLKMDADGRNDCLDDSLTITYNANPAPTHSLNFLPSNTNLPLSIVPITFTEPNLTVTMVGACEPVALEDGLDLDLHVIPNPNQGAFRISGEWPGTDPVALYLFDVQGRKVWEASAPDGQTELDLQLQPGLYILRAVQGEQVQTKRVMVQ